MQFWESEFEFLLIILIRLYGEILPYIGVGVGLFNKTCTVYSAAHICLSNGFFLELLLDEMEGEGVGKNIGVRVRKNWVRATFGKVFSISEPQFPHFEMGMVV